MPTQLTVPQRVVAAAAAAQIPVYRGAFRAHDDPVTGTDIPAQPTLYAVFTTLCRPVWHYDDGRNEDEYVVLLHMYSESDPTVAEANLEAQMALQGFAVVDIQDAYDRDADLYEVLTEWRYWEARQ